MNENYTETTDIKEDCTGGSKWNVILIVIG